MEKDISHGEIKSKYKMTAKTARSVKLDKTVIFYLSQLFLFLQRNINIFSFLENSRFRT